MPTIDTVAPGTPITSAWGNDVATELNSNCVKTSGSTMFGSLIISATPTLKLRSGSDQPYLVFENTGGATFGSIQATTSALISNVLSGSHVLQIDGTNRAVLTASGLEVIGSLQATTGVFGRGDDFTQLQLVDTAGPGYASGHAFAAFYPAGTTASAGVRGAYVGFNGEGFQVQADAGNAVLQSVTAHVFLRANQILVFEAGGAERARIVSGHFLIGKTATNLATPGIELNSTGVSGPGSVRSTTNVAGVQNLYARHESAANGANENYATFHVGVTEVGSINQKTGTTGVNYNTTSDHRLKNDLGPITDGIERIKVLQPKRISWKDDPGAVEQDGFIAHEVTPAVPEAVSGDRDAVAGPPPTDAEGNPDPAAPAAGSIVPQQLDYSKLITVTVAAVKDLIGLVEALTARVDALEGATP